MRGDRDGACGAAREVPHDQGKKPIYQIVLSDQTAIGIAGFGRFTNQPAVYEAIGNATNMRIRHFKPAAWVDFNNRMLAACYIEEPADEGNLVRGARQQILDYLRETGFITADGIPEQRASGRINPAAPLLIVGRFPSACDPTIEESVCTSRTRRRLISTNGGN